MLLCRFTVKEFILWKKYPGKQELPTRWFQRAIIKYRLRHDGDDIKFDKIVLLLIPLLRSVGRL